MSQTVSSFDILNIANINIVIANKDISSPSKGRKVIAIELKPSAETRPIPQAAHPGAKIPKNMAVVPNNPAFDFFLRFEVLNEIRLIKNPKKRLVKIRVITE